MKKFTLIILIANLIISNARQRSLVYLDKVEVCGSSNDRALKVDFVQMKYNKEIGSYANLDIQIQRDIDSKTFSSTFACTRCITKEALDTCEHFGVIKPTNLCQFLRMKGMAYDAIVESYTPPLRCPFQKGITHKGRNITADPSLFTLFQLTGYFWKVNISVFDGAGYCGSLCIDVQFMNSVQFHQMNVTEQTFHP